MDYYIFQLINNFAGQYKWLDAAGIFFASYCQYVLGAGLILFMVARKDRLERIKNLKITILAFAAAVVSRLIFAEIIKRADGRMRPFVNHQVHQLILYDANYSFPSGHASFFFALSTVIYFYNKKAGLVCFAGSFLIGLARIFVGVHYPLDILCGMALGIIVGWAMAKIGKKYLALDVIK